MQPNMSIVVKFYFNFGQEQSDQHVKAVNHSSFCFEKKLSIKYSK